MSQSVGRTLSGVLALVQVVGSTVAGQVVGSTVVVRVVGWLELVQWQVEAVVGWCRILGPYRSPSPYSGQVPVPQVPS